MKLIFSDEIESEEELSSLAKKVFQAVDSNSILLLAGDLGAGKTTFVGYFCRLLNIPITPSPTYAVCNSYKVANVRVLHFDLYRLQGADEIQSSGFYDLLNEEASYKFIEWPDRLELLDYPLGAEKYRLDFKINGNQNRIVSMYKV